jgi:hypothetical protein
MFLGAFLLWAQDHEVKNQTKHHQHQDQRHRAALRRATGCCYRIRNKKLIEIPSLLKLVNVQRWNGSTLTLVKIGHEAL